MFQFQNPFDASNIDPSQNFTVPLDNYTVCIVSSEPKETNDKTGGYIQMDLRILEGQYAGTVIADRVNLFNANEQAVRIAQARMSAYCHVTGKFRLSNTAELHNIPFKAKIGPQEKDARYNQVYTIMYLDGTPVGKKNANPAAASGQIPTQPSQNTQPAGWPPQAQPPWTPAATQSAPSNQPPWAASQPAAPQNTQPWLPPQPNYNTTPPANAAPQGWPPAQAQPQQPAAPNANPNTPPWARQ